MKKLLLVIVAVVFVCYIVFSIFLVNEKGTDAVCRGVTVGIKDSADRNFITRRDVIRLLRSARIYPVDTPLRAVNTALIERRITENGPVDRAKAYKTPSGIIYIEITQKTPILRVFVATGESYYIDEHGHSMAVSSRYAAYLPVASGSIEKTFAKSDLYKFALFLHKHNFWNNQIEQIFVYPNKEIELTPRVGDFRIFLGSFDDFEEKMNHLQLFYEQAIPKVGWDKYEMINLKYKNQIVCTKR